MIKNIDFPEETARKTVLSIIELLVRKLPDEFLEKFIDLYYFSLVTRYVNEESERIRTKITDTIVSLFKRKIPVRSLPFLFFAMGGFDTLIV